METIVLNNNTKCPAFGLGTWLANPGEVGNSIKHAIDIGYRLFDCAWIYGNEKEIGEGLRAKIEDGTVKRDELYVITKLWNTFHEEENVVPACRESLKNFGLDYIDLYLVHWPCAQKNVGKFDNGLPFQNAIYTDYDIVRTWKGMEECVRLGLVKSIGLSNFNSRQIQKIIKNATIQPVANEIEVNLYMNQKKLILFCRDRNIHIIAYSPLGSPARPWAKPGDHQVPIEDEKIAVIAKKYNKSTAQVILRYVYQLGTIPIPKSSNPERLEQNFAILDFELTNEEMKLLEGYNRNLRVCPADELKNSPEYPFKGVEF